MSPTGLPRRARIELALQRTLALVVSPLTTLAVAWLLRAWLGLRVANSDEVRRAWRELWLSHKGPLLVWLAHGESPGPWALVGGVIVIGAITMRAMVRPRTA